MSARDLHYQNRFQIENLKFEMKGESRQWRRLSYVAQERPAFPTTTVGTQKARKAKARGDGSAQVTPQRAGPP
jgi:hypothetical protein